jgi:hypothetical protein
MEQIKRTSNVSYPQFPRKLPKAQRVNWKAGTDAASTGISFWNEGEDLEDFLPWSHLEQELTEQLLPKLFGNPTGFRFVVKDHHDKKNWLMRVINEPNNESYDVWLGGDPDNGWAFDGLVRIGNAEAPKPPYVWQIYQRYSDGSYRRLPSLYGKLEKAKEI